ncbi:hypothetical protein QQF64_023527 [Cirrhinus molitorella]|uniref:Uncharacterized protein n=1 Tax=Cirrhinus molitorella TaxID=172907 RepID=A0ABR3L5F0_9TELE
MQIRKTYHILHTFGSLSKLPGRIFDIALCIVGARASVAHLRENSAGAGAITHVLQYRFKHPLLLKKSSCDKPNNPGTRLRSLRRHSGDVTEISGLNMQCETALSEDLASRLLQTPSPFLPNEDNCCCRPNVNLKHTCIFIMGDGQFKITVVQVFL